MRKLCIMLLNNQYIREEKKFLKMKHCLIQKKKKENNFTEPEIHHK